MFFPLCKPHEGDAYQTTFVPQHQLRQAPPFNCSNEKLVKILARVNVPIIHPRQQLGNL